MAGLTAVLGGRAPIATGADAKKKEIDEPTKSTVSFSSSETLVAGERSIANRPGDGGENRYDRGSTNSVLSVELRQPRNGADELEPLAYEIRSMDFTHPLRYGIEAVGIGLGVMLRDAVGRVALHKKGTGQAIIERKHSRQS
jgi:hypothetical protein